jgi:hypothetical protein
MLRVAIKIKNNFPRMVPPFSIITFHKWIMMEKDSNQISDDWKKWIPRKKGLDCENKINSVPQLWTG